MDSRVSSSAAAAHRDLLIIAHGLATLGPKGCLQTGQPKKFKTRKQE